MAAPSKWNLLSNRLFGRYGDTEKIEAQRNALEKEYSDYLNFEQTKEYIRFSTLKKWVDTGEHVTIKKELQALQYKGSDEYLAERELKALAKSKPIKNYLKLKQSDIPEFLTKMRESGLIDEFISLKKFIDQPEYKKNRNQYRKNNSAEYQKELRFLQLKKNADIKRYFRLESSKAVALYFEVQGSDTLKRYLELNEKVNSDAFKQRKAYLLSKDKFSQSEAYAKLKEFKELETSEKIRWYLSVSKGNKFNELRQWKLAFYDDFDSATLDQQKWLTKLFWGDVLLNKAYSHTSCSHCYTDGANLELNNSLLRIITRKENHEGLAWDAKYGFLTKSFSYTSGVINTGHIYRQKSGRVEAKVRFSSVRGVSHLFYLVGHEMLPEIDVLYKEPKGKVVSGMLFRKKDNGLVAKLRTATGITPDMQFYIFGVEWDHERIIWTVNGKAYKVERNPKPGLPLYLVLASGVDASVSPAGLPAVMEIDWVKCWEKA